MAHIPTHGLCAMRFDFIKPALAGARKLRDCHVIVCGNEKGGSGKSTTAMHVAIGLQKLGFQVATVDIDTRQQSLTRFNIYRRRWMDEARAEIVAPAHYSLSHEAAMMLDSDAEKTNADFAALIDEWRASYDFIVIDTPGSFTALSSAAHHQADTLVTPINDSFLDFDVLANINPQTFEIESFAQYATSVRETRRIRQAGGDAILDWIVVRNRLSTITSRNEKRVDGCLRELSMRLGFRVADGIAERVVFRESFHRGLTALDNTADNENGMKLSMSNLAARNEVRALINAMRLPIDAQGKKRAETRKMWLGQQRPTVAVPDIFAD